MSDKPITDSVLDSSQIEDKTDVIDTPETDKKSEDVVKAPLEQDESSKKRSLDEADIDTKSLESETKKQAVESSGVLLLLEAKEEKKEEINNKEGEAELDLQTKDEEKLEKNNNKQEDKPKFVFGSTTSFGNTSAFSLFSERKSIFSTEPDSQKEDSKEKVETLDENPAVKPIFGGGSAFGNAFQKALNKKSIFEQEQENNEDVTKDEEKELTPSKDSVYQKVHLEKKEITTGEEEEETLFAVKSKLYTLDLTNVKDGWKEKGVGVLRLNKSKDDKLRLLMRADAILKVILNVPIIPKFEIFHGMESSLNGEKFLRFNFIENDKPVQYALKFGQADNATKLYNLIKDSI